MALLEVTRLSVDFVSPKERVRVVEDVHFSVEAGQTHALVGESGSGKTVSASSIMRILPQPQGQISSGSIVFDGKDILKLSEEELPQLRGGRIAMIFQEPMTALNPVKRVGLQIRESLDLHRPQLSLSEKNAEVFRLLREVELPNPERNYKAYPFQLSGGMRQRIMIALALAGEPELLIADEPTTALDVTVQAQILRLLHRIQEARGMGILYISHDLGLVAQISQWISIMYAGQIVETGPASEVLTNPLHPYTRGLINSSPRIDSIPKTLFKAIPGLVPSPKDYAQEACRFADRCSRTQESCRKAAPRLDTWRLKADRKVRCFFAGQD